MGVTIKDVARRAGVSPITVSRAFSGTHPVAAKTQHKILAVAEELGYVPHLMARALASKHNPMIGAVVTTLSNPFFAPVIDAIQEVAQQSGYLTIINQSKSDPALGSPPSPPPNPPVLNPSKTLGTNGEYFSR